MSNLLNQINYFNIFCSRKATKTLLNALEHECNEQQSNKIFSGMVQLACSKRNFTLSIKSIALSLMLIFLTAQKSSGQEEPQPPEESNPLVCNPTQVNCPPNPMWQGSAWNLIEDEIDLWHTLCWLKTQNTVCDVPTMLYFETNRAYDLSLLPPDAFPLEVPTGVQLMGDFTLGNVVPPYLRYGTRIFFPYTYEGGWANYVIDLSEICYTYDNQAAVFRLADGSAISNVCLEGPKKDTKDWRYIQYRDICTEQDIPPQEGLCSGILVVGNRCSVENCEIFGFPFAAVIVRDMIKTSGNNISTPSNCYNNVTQHGEFFFRHNYIHHNKAYGFGYGLWVSSGSGVNHCSPTTPIPPCLPPPNPRPDITAADFWNYIRPEEDAIIENNVFAENKHDIAASGTRTSLYISHNTFAEAGADYNINMHPPIGAVCNPMFDPNLQSESIFAYGPYFTTVGGSVISVHDNAFYRINANLQLPYPNINECVPGNPAYPFEFPRIEVDQNFFFTTPTQIATNGTALDWAPGSGPLRTGYAKFELGGDPYFHYSYDFFGPTGDPHIQVGEMPSVQFHNLCEALPFTHNGIVNSNVPFAQINSQPGGGTILPDGTILAPVATAIDFTTDLCTDADQSQPPALQQLNIWNFNDANGVDEVRTENGNITTPVTVSYDKVGINNVSLFSINVEGNAQQHTRSSNVAKQRVITYDQTGDIHFTFWIKDTYVGNQMELYPPLGVSSPYRHGVHGGALGSRDNRPTGFLKYASINGVLLWIDDIEGDEGWQYVDIILGSGTPLDELMRGDVEIGIMSNFDPETMLAPDAELIKGVTFL
ncbi:MAG TPA: right-handed parallel beta-helix repeat-containing protein [Bacteroidia bacterium]|nr:right-handed parallel beta-helix repeat-containing protein [Bacteroidia bacterium]HNU33797.1 right-handed parallel beta-helix repeat-containing protein [Bacteroidia bacterium]